MTPFLSSQCVTRLFILCLLIPAGISTASGNNTLIIRPEVRAAKSRWPGLEYKELERPRVALVLSGGGARGIAQIGVLKVLERHGVPIDFIVATSLGAVVGGLYASGYTAADLESLAVNTDWAELLSLSGDTRRSDLFVRQKHERDRTFLSLRFEGFEPVLPAAVSSGQRLTDFLNSLVLQSVYHGTPGFDDLRIPFRAVSTDLISGERVVMMDGSLAEAMRASATVPLLFSPVERDTLRLIDGGLISNIPVDLAVAEGADLIIAVNTTSRMRREDELSAPWQAADQIMSIMMQSVNKEQLDLADVRITPDLGRRLSSEFTGIDTLIAEGEKAAEAAIDTILAVLEEAGLRMVPDGDMPFTPPAVAEFGSGWTPGWMAEWNERIDRPFYSTAEVRKMVRDLYASGLYADVSAEIDTTTVPARISLNLSPVAVIREVQFSGVTLLSDEDLSRRRSEVLGKPASAHAVIGLLEGTLRSYRSNGYSLARIQNVSFDTTRGAVIVSVSEGIVSDIRVVGTERTKDYVVRREVPIQSGDVFVLDKAKEGVANLNGTTLFEYVQIDIAYLSAEAELIVRVRERPSQLLSIGIRSDNERNLQGLLEIRDDNFLGTASSLGLTLAGGSRNQEYLLDFHSDRIFKSNFSFQTEFFYRVLDSYTYADADVAEVNCWRRDESGEYRDRRLGGLLAFGTQIERIGNAYVEYSLQNVKVKNLENAPQVQQEYDLSLFRIGTVVDSKDSYPFPTSGVGMDFSFEFAVNGLAGGDIGYNALRAMYEMFATWGDQHTLHPVLTIGFADRTMPFGEQFRLGGLDMMYGTREDNRRGRQLLLLNLEYRWKIPFQVLFDTYLSLRYDLGTISEIPEQIKLSAFHHGLGGGLSIDTPIGPGTIAAGKSFFFVKNQPVQQGPILFYFMIGYRL